MEISLPQSLEGIFQVRVFILALLDKPLQVALAKGLDISLFDVLLHAFAACFVWSDEGPILPERATAKGSIENLDRIKSHARSDLYQNKLLDVVLLSKHFLVLVQDLIGSEPNLIFVQFEAEHVVNEGLTLGMIFRRVKHLADKFFLYAQRGRAIEGLVEGKQRSAVLEAVA